MPIRAAANDKCGSLQGYANCVHKIFLGAKDDVRRKVGQRRAVQPIPTIRPVFVSVNSGLRAIIHPPNKVTAPIAARTRMPSHISLKDSMSGKQCYIVHCRVFELSRQVLAWSAPVALNPVLMHV